MKEFKYIITDPLGLHARAAGLFVKQVSAYKCKITIDKDGKEVDASRIMGVMALGVKHGTQVIIRCEGENEDNAAKELEAFFKENL